MYIPVDAVSPILYFGRFWSLTLFLCVLVVHSSVFELLQDSSVVVRITSHVAAEALQVSNSFCKMFMIIWAKLSHLTPLSIEIHVLDNFYRSNLLLCWYFVINV